MRDLTQARTAPARMAVAIVAAAAALAFALLAPASIGAQEASYSADLSGANEVPAIDSAATGTFTATIDDAAQTITYTLSVPSIEGANAAHIHQGGPTENGPVVLPLYASDGDDSIDFTATLGAADLVGPLEGDWAGFLAGMSDGALYVNVHTAANPAGEVRGQIVAEPAAEPEAATTDESPAPADTGNAGMASTADAGAVAALALLTAAIAVVGGARVLTGRTTRR